MSEFGAQGPYTPPHAVVDEPFQHEGGIVDATRESRLAAVFIDGLPVSVIVGVVVAIMLPGYLAYGKAVDAGLEPPPSSDVFLGLTLGIGALSLLAYCIYNVVLVHRYGQTFGKRVMKIRVVRTDGTRATFARIFVLRWLITTVAGLLPFLVGVASLVDALLIFRESRQCLHDSIADTKVVTAASSEEATLVGSSGAHLRTISF